MLKFLISIVVQNVYFYSNCEALILLFCTLAESFIFLEQVPRLVRMHSDEMEVSLLFERFANNIG